jgi:hypothetical protein
MPPKEISTSLLRTYRYLRIGIAGTIVVIFISVGVAATSVGWLTSVSDYYYTPARDAFVGALIAAALALAALSGRGPERALLDAAALFLPLVALVPTTLAPGTVPGIFVPCRTRCFPPAFEADAANGVITYLIAGGLTVVVALLLASLRQLSLTAVGFSLVTACAVLLAVALTWAFEREAFLQQGHFVAMIAFFGLFATVAILNAFPRRGAPPAPIFRALYTAIAVLLAAGLVGYIVLLRQPSGSDLPIGLVAEAAALALFFAFWVVQGIQNWDEVDPLRTPI